MIETSELQKYPSVRYNVEADVTTCWGMSSSSVWNSAILFCTRRRSRFSPVMRFCCLEGVNKPLHPKLVLSWGGPSKPQHTVHIYYSCKTAQYSRRISKLAARGHESSVTCLPGVQHIHLELLIVALKGSLILQFDTQEHSQFQCVPCDQYNTAMRLAWANLRKESV